MARNEVKLLNLLKIKHGRIIAYNVKQGKDKEDRSLTKKIKEDDPTEIIPFLNKLIEKGFSVKCPTSNITKRQLIKNDEINIKSSL